jgi:ABC-2 type transport system ATP-binding protein
MKLTYDAPAARDPRPLVLDGLTKHWGERRALADVALEVRPGEIFALLGPNGAGKTTLIGCVTGLVRPSAGTIHVFGHDAVREFRAARRLIGLVPQEIGFDPFFTPHETLMLQMGLMGMRPDAARADDLLRLLALHDRRDAYTRTLSGGMKRRLLVAKALVHAPPLLFLDEPTAGVDVELRKDLWDEVRRLRERGTTVILTTHYLEEAEKLADRIGVIHRGRLLLVEEREALMKRMGGAEVVLRTEDTAELPEGFDAQLGPDGLSIRAPLPDAGALARLIAAASTRNTVVDVNVARRSLEEIFVDLIRAADGGAEEVAR